MLPRRVRDDGWRSTVGAPHPSPGIGLRFSPLMDLIQLFALVIDADSDSDDDRLEPVHSSNYQFDSLLAQESDFHAIKPLLQQLTRNASVDLTDLTDLIISQSHIGCVIKQADDIIDGAASERKKDDILDVDDTVFAVMTVVNIAERKQNKCVRDMMKWISSKMNADEKSAFSSVIAGKRIGWFINERFFNLPVQIAPPMYQALGDDLAEANAKGEKFEFDYFLVISKTLEVRTSPLSSGDASKKNKRRRKAGDPGASDAPEINFLNVEDELLVPLATFKAAFKCEGETTPGMKHVRTVLLIDRRTFFERFLENVKQAVRLPEGATTTLTHY
eukprot:m.542208 g.542208  ORF g.542208 m.542208 type:complete len:332 (-) comp22114_c0_seq20:2134-3129(-)